MITAYVNTTTCKCKYYKYIIVLNTYENIDLDYI